MMAMLARMLWLLLAILGIALAGCAPPNKGAPATSGAQDTVEEQPTPADPVSAAALRRYGGAYTEGNIAAYLAATGRRLLMANGLDPGAWRFTVLSSPVANAFATERRDVFVTRGLLAVLQDEAELAAVIGHEMAHIMAGHAAQRRAQEARIFETAIRVARSTRDPQLALAFAEMELAQARAYSREQEFEADRIAIRLITTAGYDSGGALRSLQRLQDYTALHLRELGLSPDAEAPQSRFATHPRTLDRAEAARAETGKGNGGRQEGDAYLDAIDGMLYGDAPQEGFVRGRKFLHPELGFTFEVPPGYTLLNRSKSVQARGPGNAYMMFACTSRQPEDGMVDAMRRLFPSVPLTEARTLTINGLDAATGVTPRSANSGDISGRVVTIRFPPGMCTFLLVSRALGPPARAREMLRAAQTFRRLSPAEAAQVRPLRLAVVQVRPGDTVQRLVARSPGDDAFRTERFLMLNDLQPGEPLTPGRRVKLVVSQ